MLFIAVSELSTIYLKLAHFSLVIKKLKLILFITTDKLCSYLISVHTLQSRSIKRDAWRYVLYIRATSLKTNIKN